MKTGKANPERIRKQKRLLLRWMPEEDYDALILFVQNIILDESNVKILMARKLVTLYFALYDLAMEEDYGRVRKQYEEKYSSGENEPVIISNHAISGFFDENKGFSGTVLIADDLVKHGRSLYRIYKKLTDVYKIDESQIKIRAMCVMKDRDLCDDELKNKIVTQEEREESAWRVYSDEIVNSFFASMEPYIAFTPAFRFNADQSKAKRSIRETINKISAIDLEEPEYRMHGVSAKVVSMGDADHCTQFRVVRIYENTELSEMLIVPLEIPKPMRRECMESIYKDISVILNVGNGDKYIEMLYTYSLLVAVSFLDKCGISRDEQKAALISDYEEMHFARRLVKENKVFQLKAEELENMICRKQMTSQMGGGEIENGHKDFSALIKCLDNMLSQHNNSESGNTAIFSENTSADLVAQFLSESNMIDRDNWKNRGDRIVDRLIGIPLTILNDRLSARGITDKSIIRQLLQCIDLGRGAVVTIQTHPKNYCIPVIHAGEQNYKYWEKKHYSYLYGVYFLENEAIRRKRDAKEARRVFDDWYWEQFDKTTTSEKEKDFVKNINIASEIGKVLETDALIYPEQERLCVLMEKAEEIIAND